MSGGSMNYAYINVEEYAYMLEDRELIEFAKDFAQLLHDCEWYHSSDTDRERYLKTVKEFKDKWFKSDRNERLARYINEIYDNAKRECLELIGGETQNVTLVDEYGHEEHLTISDGRADDSG